MHGGRSRRVGLVHIGGTSRRLESACRDTAARTRGVQIL
jgi:hypothetical protein